MIIGSSSTNASENLNYKMIKAILKTTLQFRGSFCQICHVLTPFRKLFQNFKLNPFEIMCDDSSRMMELLTQKGYMQSWRAQVMADILLPHLNDNLTENRHEHMCEIKKDPMRRLLLMAVKEFFRNMGLTSAERVFEIEANIEGDGEAYNDMIKNTFHVIETTQDHLRPPIVSQMIFIYGLENGLNFATKACNVNFDSPTNSSNSEQTFGVTSCQPSDNEQGGSSCSRFS